MALPTDIRETIDMCRHCFMCRHANPTFLVTKLDAHTPRGYALALSRVDAGLTTWSDDLVAKLYQSTLDGLCSELCEFDWREDLVVLAGRQEAVRLGLAPQAVVDAAERRMSSGAVAAEPLAVAPERVDREGADILFLTGLDTRERAPETISASTAILDHLDADWTIFSVERDPGIDLWELGYTDAAAVAAQRFADEVGRLRPGRIVTGSSRLLRAARESLPTADLDSLPAVEHLSEFLRGRLGHLEVTLIPMDGPVVFHDPCSLGRRARVFDAPRELIEMATGAAPMEFFHNRENAECCGEGGVLPEIDPRLAARLAAAQLARMPDGVTTLVTACPGCRAQLGAAAEAAGGDINVVDISELVASWLRLD